MRRAVLPLLLVAVVAARAPAQSPDPAPGARSSSHAEPSARWADSLRFGRRIRVERAARDEGTFISIARDSVVYQSDVSDSIVAVSLRDVRGLWVSGGHTTRALNAVAGALLGAGLSSIVASLGHQRDVRAGSFDVVRTPDYRQAAAVGAGFGFLVGLASGGREEWHRVWPPRGRE